MKKYGKKLIFTLIVNCFVVFTACFFAPIEIFLGNVIEFSFSFKNIWWIMLLFSAFSAVAVSLLESLLPEKVVKVLNALAFSLGLCFYVQSMFLNGKMGSLTGDADEYSRGVIIGNLAVWAAIFALDLILLFVFEKKKKTYVLTGMKFVSVAIVLMQLTGFISACLTTDFAETVKGGFFSSDHEFELAEKNNVVYFLIDTCDNDYVDEALEKYPDMFDNFEGFTYFPNAISTHSRTYPSVPYMLTREKCYFDKPYAEYISDAYENGHFLDDMKTAGADIRVFTESNYTAGATDVIDNYFDFDSSGITSPVALIKQMIKISGYRCMPYLIKDKFAYTSAYVNEAVLSAPPDKAFAEDEYRFYNLLKDTGISVNKEYDGAFRFYHMWGTHGGYQINQNVELAPNENSDALRGCIKIIEDYMQMMKEQNVYDSSTIIVTADHGFSNASEDLSLTHANSCIMLVKPANAEKAEMKISNAPVCHEDLFPTCLKAVGGETDERTIFDIEENEERERYYYHTALYSDEDGEVVLREYAVNGDANELESYKATGKYWDVNYSERQVSKNRFSGE